MCEQDVFASRLSYFACHDTVSYYDTTHTSLFINCHATSDFCLGGMHDTSYNTPIVTREKLPHACAIISPAIPRVVRTLYSSTLTQI
jgi:hypothetical protein